MPKYKDEEGNEVEAFTPEEVEAKINEIKTSVAEEVKSEYEEKLNEKEESMSKFEEERASLEQRIEELSKVDDGDRSKNFKVLKDALNKKDNQIEELRKEMGEVANLRVNDFKERIIDKYAAGDEELKKKIMFNFDSTLSSVQAKSEKDIENKIKSAVKLSVDEFSPSVLDQALSGSFNSGSKNIIESSGNVEFSEGEKKIGAKLGISDEDYKKYGPRLKNK
jgi:G3E family GTPase